MFYIELKEYDLRRVEPALPTATDNHGRFNARYFCFSSGGTSFTPGRMVKVELNFL
jgi:hypothetical protein